MNKLRAIFVFSIAFLAFIPAIIFLSPKALYIIANDIIFTTSFAVSLIYWRATRFLMFQRFLYLTYADYLSFGVFCIFFALAAILGHNLILQLLGVLIIANPTNGLSVWYYGPQAFYRWVGTIGAVLHLAAWPINGRASPSRRNLVVVAVAIGAGLGLAFWQMRA